MILKRLLQNLLSKLDDARGVTLMELILVIAIMTLIFGGVVSLLISLYDSYELTRDSSRNGREATMIINQLSQDIRKSVGDEENKPVRINEETEGILITTQKRADESAQTVEYRNQAGKIVYVTAEGREIELSQSGEIDVVTEDEKRYQLTVTVGNGTGKVHLTTEVARYDWGEFLDAEPETP